MSIVLRNKIIKKKKYGEVSRVVKNYITMTKKTYLSNEKVRLLTLLEIGRAGWRAYFPGRRTIGYSMEKFC